MSFESKDAPFTNDEVQSVVDDKTSIMPSLKVLFACLQDVLEIECGVVHHRTEVEMMSYTASQLIGLF
jgi:hypothetical protein